MINLTRAQFNDLIVKGKKIGQGTDGVCYRQGKKVYKIYHTSHKVNLVAPIVLDSSGVRVPNKEDFKTMKTSYGSIIQYVTEDETRLSTENGLLKAIELGNSIKGTNLPSDIIYINGVARGCVYPYYKHVSSIHKSYRRSLKTRLKICMSLYEKVKELVDNNIYPIDLAQKSRERLFDKRKCNVFLSFRNEPIIIDLDGKSALYTETHNKTFEEKTCHSLMTLMLEIITREDLQEDMNDEDFDTVRFYLKNNGLSLESIEKFFDCNMNMEDVSKSLDEITNKLVKKIK